MLAVCRDGRRSPIVLRRVVEGVFESGRKVDPPAPKNAGYQIRRGPRPGVQRQCAAEVAFSDRIAVFFVEFPRAANVSVIVVIIC